MNLIPNVVTQTVFRGALHIRKSGPNLAFAGGIAGVLAGTVLACRATLQLAEDLPEMKEEIALVKNHVNDEEQHDRAMAYLYGKNVLHVGKLYGPAVLVGFTGLGLLTGSHVTLNRRNAELTAAYVTINKAYNEYRDRVKESLGEEKEGDLYRGLSKAKVVGEDGKKVDVKVADPNGLSPYARFFDEASTEFTKSAEYNRMYVKTQLQHANDRLHSRKHLFLNEVYDMLGLERTPEGQVVGWVISTDGTRDNYVDFGLDEEHNRRFMNGTERAVLLDFNVDGVVYNLI